MTHAEKASACFKNGYYCSQAVLTAFAGELDLAEEQAMKIAQCFNSGMRKGEVCGACTGALMVLGLKYGTSCKDDVDRKNESNKKSSEFLDRFKSVNGSYICNELLGCDITCPSGIHYAKENNLFRGLCPKLVESAVRILDEICD